MARLTIDSPVGALTLTVAGGAVVELVWGQGPGTDDDPLAREAAAQLRRYFADGRTSFSLPLKPVGTPFQRRVWQAMCTIPAGRTETYGALASRIGGSPRAIGMACARNPVPIIIPCHRVVAAGGALGGYSGVGGLATKQWLLGHERPASQGSIHPAPQPGRPAGAPVVGRPG